MASDGTNSVKPNTRLKATTHDILELILRDGIGPRESNPTAREYA